MKILFFLLWALHFVIADQTIISLPQPQKTGGMPLMAALNNRQTQRAFSDKKLPLQLISNLLWAGCGINRENGKRTAPSAVNWQEIDIYVAMDKGVYLYNPVKNQLELVLEKDIRKFTGKQDFTDHCPLNLIYVADYTRMNTEKAKKDFYSATDTGFISQNIYLFCASEGLATVVIGAVNKIYLKEIMELNNDQHVILTQSIGYPAN